MLAQEFLFTLPLLFGLLALGFLLLTLLFFLLLVQVGLSLILLRLLLALKLLRSTLFFFRSTQHLFPLPLLFRLLLALSFFRLALLLFELALIFRLLAGLFFLLALLLFRLPLLLRKLLLIGVIIGSCRRHPDDQAREDSKRADPKKETGLHGRISTLRKAKPRAEEKLGIRTSTFGRGLRASLRSSFRSHDCGRLRRGRLSGAAFQGSSGQACLG
ncbi:MAG TPA: hypothetical protein VMG10_27860 [Gemmataceae bacterium]|nr:hypothetical protein [Gemmataceae bacterium]